MAVSFTQLAAISTDTSNTTSYAGNAGTPAANDLLIAFVSATGTVAVGSMTGTWTWKKLFSFTFNSGVDTIYVFWAIATAATSTTPTFDCTGDAATGASIYCLRVAGDQLQNRPFIRQIRTATGTSTNPAVSMAQAILTGSGVCGVAANGTSSATQWTAPGSWTENGEVAAATPSGSMEVASRASGETGSTITWTNSNTTAWGALVLEIAVAGSVPFDFPAAEIDRPRPQAVRLRPQQELVPNTAALVAGAPPVMPRYHSIPSAFKRAARAITDHVIPNLLLTTLAVTAAPFVTREADARPPAPRRAPQADVCLNLHVSTLGPYVQKPVPGFDESLAPRVRRAPPGESPPTLNTTTLAPVVVNPAIQAREDAPPGPRRNVPRETVPQNLLGTTLAPSAPADTIVARQHVLPNRITANRSTPIDPLVPNLLVSTLAAAPPAQAPFRNPEEQVPSKPRRVPPQQLNPNLLTVPGYEVLGVGSIQSDSGIIPNRVQVWRLAARDPEFRNLVCSTLFVPPPPESAVGTITVDSLGTKFAFRAKIDPEIPSRLALRSGPQPIPKVQPEQLQRHPRPLRAIQDAEVPNETIRNQAGPPPKVISEPIQAQPRARRAIQDLEITNSTVRNPGGPPPDVIVPRHHSLPRRLQPPVRRLGEEPVNVLAVNTPQAPPVIRPEVQMRVRPPRAIQEPEAPNRTLLLPPGVASGEFIVRLASFGQAGRLVRYRASEDNGRNLAIATAPIVNPQVLQETPLPVRPRRAFIDPEIPSRIAVVTAVPAPPKVQVEIPLGVRPRAAWRDPEHQGRIALLTAPAAPPFTQVEAALPVHPLRAPFPPETDLEVQSRISLLTAPAAPPFVQSDRALPQPRPLPANRDPEIQNRQLLLTGTPPPLPPVQVELAVYPRPERVVPTDPVGLTTPQLMPPFVQAEPELNRRRPRVPAMEEKRFQGIRETDPRIQQEIPLKPKPLRAKLDPEHQSRIALLTAFAPPPFIQVDTSVPCPVIPAIWIPDQFNVLVLATSTVPSGQLELDLVPAEDRTYVVPAGDRTYKVAAEDRRYLVPPPWR